MGGVHAVDDTLFIHGPDGSSGPGIHAFQVGKGRRLPGVLLCVELQIPGQEHRELRAAQSPVRAGVEQITLVLAGKDLLLIELAHIRLRPVALQIREGMIGFHSYRQRGPDGAAGGGDGAGASLPGGGKEAVFINGPQLGVHRPAYVLRGNLQIRVVVGGGDRQLGGSARDDGQRRSGAALSPDSHGIRLVHHQNLPLVRHRRRRRSQVRSGPAR